MRIRSHQIRFRTFQCVASKRCVFDIVSLVRGYISALANQINQIRVSDANGRFCIDELRDFGRSTPLPDLCSAKTLPRGFNVPQTTKVFVRVKASISLHQPHSRLSPVYLCRPDPQYKDLSVFPCLISFQCPPAPSASILSSHLWLSPVVRTPLDFLTLNVNIPTLGHVYCHACIAGAINATATPSSPITSCPTCREPVSTGTCILVYSQRPLIYPTQSPQTPSLYHRIYDHISYPLSAVYI